MGYDPGFDQCRMTKSKFGTPFWQPRVGERVRVRRGNFIGSTGEVIKLRGAGRVLVQFDNGIRSSPLSGDLEKIND